MARRGKCLSGTLKLQASYPGTLPDAWNNLGLMATREGRTDEAIACFQQALKLDPHHLFSLDNLGNAYRQCRTMGRGAQTYSIERSRSATRR